MGGGSSVASHTIVMYSVEMISILYSFYISMHFCICYLLFYIRNNTAINFVHNNSMISFSQTRNHCVSPEKFCNKQ